MEREQILGGESGLAPQRLPHRQQPVAISGVLGYSCGVGKCTIKERPLPLHRGSNGLLLGKAHRSRTHRAIVVTVPVRRHAQLRVRLWPLVASKSANPEMAPRSAKKQWRMRISSAIQLPENFVTSTVAEEHGANLGRRPPHDGIGCSGDHVLRQNLNFRRLPQLGDQGPQHILSQKLRRSKPDVTFFVGHLVHGNEWMTIGVSVIITLPVYQQRPAQLELLSPAYVDGGLHRRFLGSFRSFLWPQPVSASSCQDTRT